MAEQVAESFEASLRNLRTNYIDCLVMHSPEDEFEQTMEVWRAMEALIEGGRVKQLGVSNCYDIAEFEALYSSANVKPAVLQNRFYDETDYDRKFVHSVQYTRSPTRVSGHLPRILMCSNMNRNRPDLAIRTYTCTDTVPLSDPRSGRTVDRYPIGTTHARGFSDVRIRTDPRRSRFTNNAVLTTCGASRLLVPRRDLTGTDLGGSTE